MDETALWTHRTATLRVEFDEGIEVVRGVAARAAAGGDASDGTVGLPPGGKADENVTGASAPGEPLRLQFLNSGRVKEARRRLFHLRRRAKRDLEDLYRRTLADSGQIKAVARAVRARLRAAFTDSADSAPSSTPKPAPAGGETERGPGAAAPPRAHPTASTAPAQAPATPPAPTLADRRRAFEAKGTPAALSALVNVLYRDGQLREPGRLLAEHSAMKEAMTPQQLKVVRNIEDQARMLEHPPTVPMRVEGTAHRPEPGRILYCAHAVYPYQSNGYAIRTRGIVNGMRDAGHDVVVAARPGFPWDAKSNRSAKRSHSFAERVDGVEYVFSHGPSLKGQSVAEYLESAVDSYLSAIARTRPAHVHAASNHLTALPALIAARLTGIPFTYEVRGFWEYALVPGEEGLQERGELAGILEDLVLAEADHVMVLTAEMRDELVTRGVSPEKMLVTPNGVDTRQFQPLPAVGDVLAKLDIDSAKTVIGYVGSMVEYEGLEDLVEACILLSRERTDFQLVMAGDGPVMDRVRERLSQEGNDLEHRLLGRINANHVPQLMNRMDVIACPRSSTRVTRLVSPLKPLEALAAGVPVVLSDVPVLASFAAECGAAETFASGDVPDLAAALRRLLDDPERRSVLGRRGRRWVVENRRWDLLGGQMADAVLGAVPPKSEPAMELNQVRVGIIADTFTISAFHHAVEVVVLDRAEWRRQLREERLDVVFVESAWSGNDKTWTRGVGHYSDEESADLRGLLEECRSRSVPTVFWNKEDPVHFKRFIENARLFDLVLTTDNRSIPGYQACTERGRQQVGSLPFFAHPRLHHPVTEGDAVVDRPVTYAGSYYGDRYKDRSEVLLTLLEAAREYGLTIFDRQADLPDSPYRFPDDLQPFVAGGLPYEEMVKAYRRYPVHVNVNSVTHSETMFSRRVMEIAASGGVVLSGPSAAVNHMFVGLVPTVGRAAAARAALSAVMTDPVLRNVQGWNLRRFVRRAHTLENRLLIALRRVGLPVRRTEPPRVHVVVDGTPTETGWEALLEQTMPPAHVHTQTPPPPAVADRLEHRGVTWDDEAAPEAGPGTVLARWDGSIVLDRTALEDLVDVTVDSGSSAAVLDVSRIEGLQTPLARLVEADEAPAGPLRVEVAGGDGNTVLVRRGLLRGPQDGPASAPTPAEEVVPARTEPLKVVVAGHDLKFAGELIARLRADGHDVRIDQWQSHTDHDRELSTELVAWADVVVCEWGLGNAVWYSRHVGPQQRLLVRVHSQELFRTHLARIRAGSVDRFVFVAPHVRDAARRFKGVAGRRCEVVPNIVSVGREADRSDDSRFRIGLVGIVPQGKRLDRALDVLHEVRAQDERFTLHIRGKRPEEYGWMAAREDEMSYYRRQFRRIEEDPLLRGAVHFEGYTADRDELEDWYRSMGAVLSVSDFESFHFTLADGPMQGAVPVTLGWPGADRLFPSDWIHADTASMAESILELTDAGLWAERSEAARAEVLRRFDPEAALGRWSEIVAGRG